MSFYSTIHAIKDRVNWELYGLHLANLYAKVYSLAGQAKLLLYRLCIILAAQVQVSFPFQVSVSKFSTVARSVLCVEYLYPITSTAPSRKHLLHV